MENSFMINKRKVRCANQQERQAIVDLEFSDSSQGDRQGMRDQYTYITMEGYMDDGPGYAGKITFAVYGTTGAYQMFTWDGNNKPKHVNSEILRPIARLHDLSADQNISYDIVTPSDLKSKAHQETFDKARTTGKTAIVGKVIVELV